MLVNDRVAAVAAAVLGLVSHRDLRPMLVATCHPHRPGQFKPAPFTPCTAGQRARHDPLGRSMLGSSSWPAAPRCRSRFPRWYLRGRRLGDRHVGRLLPRVARDRRDARRRRDHELPSLLLAVVVLYVFSSSAANIVAVLAITRIPVYCAPPGPNRPNCPAGVSSTPHARSAPADGPSSPGTSCHRVADAADGRHLDFCYVMLAEQLLELPWHRYPAARRQLGTDGFAGPLLPHTAWWLLVLPGLAIVITTVSATILAAWARIAGDPAQRWRLTVPQKRLSRLHQDRKGPLDDPPS